MTARGLAFAAIVIVCVGAAGGYVFHASRRSTESGVAATTPSLPIDPSALAEPFLVFRRTGLDDGSGFLAAAPLADLASVRRSETLRCERIHIAAGSGICLAADRGAFTTYRAVLFDRSFVERGSLTLAGAPSRAQVSRDGRLAATTVFVTGHSYAAGGFSTRTSIVDLQTKAWLVEDLESFEVRRAGELMRSPELNFWGVTFTPDGRGFYATLGRGSDTFLVRGDIAARTVEVLEDAVECPSLSPDGRRIAFKSRSGGVVGPVRWRLSVLDLETRQRHPLAELRSVDDQAQWLDDEQVIYALPGEGPRAGVMDQWVVPADGGGEPRLFLPEAYSAGVARP
jgi:hypothetical protein